MSKSRIYLFLSLIFIFSAVVSALGAEHGNVHPNIELSFTERFRLVSWNNAITLDDASAGGTSFTRHRTSVMGRWFPAEPYEVGLKWTNEFRRYFVPTGSDFTLDELFVDLLYAKATFGKRHPLTVTVGRQNMILGEGFVMMDGSPLDGSRSIYFNALRADYEIAPERTLMLFYCYQDDQDEALPILHDQDKWLVEQPEEGFGAYFIGQFERLNLHTYLIRKNIKKGRSLSNVTSEINCLGARVQYPVSSRTTGTLEAVYQTGKLGDTDRKAFGGYGYLDYRTSGPQYVPQTITVGGILLSGDDPDTDDCEGWDPLFSRWPKWSESYIYTLINERGVAYWNNLTSIWGRANFTLSETLKLQLDYHHMMSLEPGPTAISGGGKTRGELVMGKLTYVINSRLNGHLLWEHFEPGSFYFDDADSYDWIRTELMLSIK